jgi:hypothetical protein
MRSHACGKHPGKSLETPLINRANPLINPGNSSYLLGETCRSIAHKNGLVTKIEESLDENKKIQFKNFFGEVLSKIFVRIFSSKKTSGKRAAFQFSSQCCRLTFLEWGRQASTGLV